jgi:hypothetical protein
MRLKAGANVNAEKGTYFRSDHWSFARMAVPSASIEFGRDVIGKPAGWGEAQQKEFVAKHYHQPSDEVTASWNYEAAAQHGDFALRVGLEIANAAAVPHWLKGREVPACARFTE